MYCLFYPFSLKKKLSTTLVKGSKEDFIQEGLMQWDFAVVERDSAQF